MSKENVNKYVYCFDEFDYLLTKLFEKNNSESINNIQFKLSIMSQQLKSCKDDSSKKQLLEDMRKMMDEGNSDELTYEFLLSELSGLTSVNGRVIIATTNFIDNIPEALKRPGRLDIVLSLDKFNREETIELVSKMYKLNDNELKKLNNAKLKEHTYTPSQIIMKRCELDKFDRLLNYLRD
jgi:SpoVK/Ycf46/Vps4 family AAA+-type ATPase